MIRNFSQKLRGYGCNKRSLSSIFVNPIVKNAIELGKPVVALESTVISHGLPYPHNISAALELESIVTDNGGIPATIGIIDGKIIVGLSREQINEFGRDSSLNKVDKCSSRDLPLILASSIGKASTTVASTAFIAASVGIKVFGTGGLGGVHRDVLQSFDISNDLFQLSQVPITIVCAGVKSILDVPKTMQLLETFGVPVVTYRSKYFPCFFSTDSSILSPHVCSSVSEISDIIEFRDDMKMKSSLIVGVPNPDPVMSHNEMNKLIDLCVEEAKLTATGKDVTPAILKKIHESSNGKSIQSNISLLKENVKIATSIAVQLSERKSPVLVVGASVVDIISRPGSSLLVANSSVPGHVSYHHGGVGRNIADAMSKMSAKCRLMTMIGNDLQGHDIRYKLTKLGIDLSFSSSHPSSSSYSAFHDMNGDLKFAVSDMSSIEQLKDINQAMDGCLAAVADGNISSRLLLHLSEEACRRSIPFIFEPTSIIKSSRILPDAIRHTSMISPNIHELNHLYNILSSRDGNEVDLSSVSIDKVREMGLLVLKHMSTLFDSHVIVKMGRRGVLRLSRSDEMLYHLNQQDLDAKVVNSNGAGDTLLAAVIVGYYIKKYDINTAIRAGMCAATQSVQSELAIPDILSVNFASINKT